jgi:hypothetical protein
VVRNLLDLQPDYFAVIGPSTTWGMVSIFKIATCL